MIDNLPQQAEPGDQYTTPKGVTYTFDGVKWRGSIIGQTVSGSTGSQGPQGIPGPAGRDGVDGAPGPQGERGDKGDTGEPGPAGKDGIQGPAGAQGPAGKDASLVAVPMNYVQEKASRSIKLTSPGQVIDIRITTTGRPVLVSVNGDANPLSNGGWCKLQLFRNNTAISNIVQAEGGNNENNPYNMSMIDNPGAGTHTYSFRMIQNSGDFQFGESDGPTMYAVELGTAVGAAGPKGDTGAQGPKGDSGSSFSIPQTGNGGSWVNFGTWTTVNEGTTLYMKIIAHNGYNTEFYQNQVTELYFKTSNGQTNKNGFYGDGSASRNTALGGNGSAPSVIKVVQNSLTSYTIFGYFFSWSNGSHYTLSTDTSSSWTHSGTLSAAPNGTNIDIIPTVSDIKISSGYVNAGNFVTLDNIKATVTTTGNRGLSVASVEGSFQAHISATFGYVNGVGGNATTGPVTYNTTPSSSWFGYHFPNQGDGSVYLVNDITNTRFYRITLMIGPGYANNFISIERLY